MECWCQNAFPYPINVVNAQKLALNAPRCWIDSAPIVMEGSGLIRFTIRSDTTIMYWVYQVLDDRSRRLVEEDILINTGSRSIRSFREVEVDRGVYVIRTACPPVFEGLSMCECDAEITIAW